MEYRKLNWRANYDFNSTMNVSANYYPVGQAITVIDKK
jgi:hypothetical protein